MKNLIRKIAWKYANQAFNQNLNIEFEELFAEANLAYLEALRTYDESKSKITTYVWHTVSGHLQNYLKEEMKHTHIPIDEIEVSESSYSYYEKLSEDAQTIATIIVNAPNDLFAMAKDEIKVKIFAEMLNENYPLHKIINGFKELSKIYS